MFLAACMIFTLLPFGAFADDTVPVSGTCGGNANWVLDNGTLTISGTGAMTSYSSKYDVPWYKSVNAITSIVVEKGITNIGNMAFRGCANAVSVSLPAGIKTIGEEAFKDCAALTDIVVPEGVESLGKYSFQLCTGLESVVLPKSLKTIGESAFDRCVSLSNISIPSGVTTISYGAFKGCKSLKSITIPDTVTSLAGSVFADCKALESATLNCRIYTIYSSLFANCSSLQSLVVPNGVKTIKRYAFEFCTSLKSIKLPATLTLVEDCAFRRCDSLKDVYYAGTQNQWTQIESWDDHDIQMTFQGKMHYNCAYEDTSAFSITTAAGKPKISWKAVSGADKYWIYRSTDGKNFKYYDSTTKTSYTNSGATIGTTYYYKVKAIDVTSNGNVTLNTTAVKSIMCRPAAPSISIYRVSGKPQLKWSAVTGASKYWIYRSTDGENYKYYDSTTKTSYTNSGANSATMYYYKVKAVAVVNGNNITSAYSNSKSLYTSLKAPTLLGGSYNTMPHFSWGGVNGADRYWIYRSTDGKNYEYLATTRECSYFDMNTFVGTTYYYKVKAVCPDNSYANSELSAAKSIKCVPDAPDISIKLSSSNKPVISWEAPFLAEKYWIYRSTDGKNFKYYDTTTKTTYTNSSASAGTTYYYKVKSVTVVNGTNVVSDCYSNTVSITAK